MKKDIIVVTGGAGFVGANLIKSFLEKTKFKIISIDNYSTGVIKNHFKSKKVTYIKGETKDIGRLLNLKKKRINAIFHFGEFARIYQSFLKMDECINSNTIGTNAVFNFCLINKIKLIYSATSASIGNKGDDKNLSPYAFTKAKNIELLNNLKRWFNFKFEILYFYNVYGPKQIMKGDMATVIGIFENLYKSKKPLTVVRPGTQSRRFTHIKDTVEACYKAWKINKCKHYSVTNRKNYTILQVARLFKTRIKLLPSRRGERYASALTNMNLSNKVYKVYGSIRLVDYIRNFIKNQKNPH
jgi:UDP-glucose 4-epimerase